MPGVYGEILAAFPELLKTFNVFFMPVLSGGGFGPRQQYRQVRAYLTRDVGGRAEQSDANFVEGQEAKFYVFDHIPHSLIRQGMYVEDGNDLFKFVVDHNFTREAGFTAHRLEIVAGPTDRQAPNTQTEENILNAY